MIILITAGDPSGDAHAARLMSAIRKRFPDVVFEGFGGPAMEMEGLRTIAHLSDLAVTGFWEVAKNIGFFRGLMKRCEELIEKRKPALFIPVDYPGFNIRLAAIAKKNLIPIAWYIAPQLWAWGKDRAEELARVVDLLLVVFPFELEFFQKHGIKTVHVGHPLIERLGSGVSGLRGDEVTGLRGDGVTEHQPHDHTTKLELTSQQVNKLELPSEQVNKFVLLPGSRSQEIHHHVPLLASTIQLMKAHDHTDTLFLVPRARNVSVSSLLPLVDAGAKIVDDPFAAMRSADAGLIKAGTSTLEACLLGLPFATFYKTSSVTYQLARRVVKINSVTMMNLLLKNNIVHEYIQRDATPQNLARELDELMNNNTRRAELRTAMEEVRVLLGGSGAAERAADALAYLLPRQ